MGKYKVTTTANLHCRKGPGTSFGSVTVLPKGKTYDSSKQSKGWYYIDSVKGWSSGKYLKATTSTKPASTKTTKASDSKTKAKAERITTQESEFQLTGEMVKMIMKKMDKSKTELNMSMRLFGAPHQFLDHVDVRVDSKKELGRKYVESYLAAAPIVSISPGRPLYLPDMSSQERKGFKEYLASMRDDSAGQQGKNVLTELLGSDEQRYFDFASDYSSYIKYVNVLCRASAIYMGIGNNQVGWETKSRLRGKYLNPEAHYHGYNWANYTYENLNAVDKNRRREKGQQGIFGWFDSKEKFFSNLKTTASEWTERVDRAVTDVLYNSLFGGFQYVRFYVDSNTSINESTSNNTQKSVVESTLDRGSDMAKELSFLLGAADAQNLGAAQAAMGNALMDGAAATSGGFMGRLLSSVGTVVSGSNMIFPEIWTENSYAKSYQISVDLLSPYGDRESIYLNVIVPMMHLLALSLPRQSSSNSYGAPFLVKASSKGWFSCEMGVIDGLSIEKIGDSWSVDGLPTHVRVEFSIKDLYSALMMSPSDRPLHFFNNQSLINFLAVNAGVDLTVSNIKLRFTSLASLLLNNVMDIENRIYNRSVESLHTWFRNINPFR